MQDEARWDAKDVAAYLKVSRSWVYRESDAGRLPAIRIGGQWRFDPAAIRAWFAAGGKIPLAKIHALPKGA